MPQSGMFDAADHAARLHRARRTGVPVELISAEVEGFSWDDARAVARACDQLRLADGEEQIGWKLGFTSAVMRQALGVDRPNWGTLWAVQGCEETLPFGGLIHPKVEPELVWRSAGALPENATADTVREVGGTWALGIEVVDPRFPSFDFDLLDNTADNSSSAAVRIGPFRRLDREPGDVRIRFGDGHDERDGSASQAMDDPCAAVAWLARALAEEGLAVGRGDIVFTGGLAMPFDAAAGVTYTVRSDGFEDLRLTFA